MPVVRKVAPLWLRFPSTPPPLRHLRQHLPPHPTPHPDTYSHASYPDPTPTPHTPTPTPTPHTPTPTPTPHTPTPTPTPHTPTPTPTPHTPTPTPTPATFVKAININGDAATINGNIWTSYSSALASGFSTSNAVYSTNITYSPHVDSATNRMLNGGIWSPASDVNFSQTLANGNYVVYLWAVENFRNNYRSYNVKLEGVQVASAIGRLSKNRWARYGPYTVTVNDGTLNVNLQRVTGDPCAQGVEIWSTATPTPPVARQHLINVATRTFVQTGENVTIGGFVISGNEAKKVLIRGLGPIADPSWRSWSDDRSRAEIVQFHRSLAQH